MAEPVLLWQLDEVIRRRVTDATISDILGDLWTVEEPYFDVASEETLVWKGVTTINGWRDATLRHYRDYVLNLFGGVKLHDETVLFERVDQLFTSSSVVFRFAINAYLLLMNTMTDTKDTTNLNRTMASAGRGANWKQGPSYRTNYNRVKVLRELQNIITAYTGDDDDTQGMALAQAVRAKTEAVERFVSFNFKPNKADVRDNYVKALRDTADIVAAQDLFDTPRTAPAYILERYQPLAGTPITTSAFSAPLVHRLFPGYPDEDTRGIAALLTELLDAYPQENGSWGEEEEKKLNRLKWSVIFALGNAYHGQDVNTSLAQGDALIKFRSLSEVPSESQVSAYVPEPAAITKTVETGDTLRLLRDKQQRLMFALVTSLQDMVDALNNIVGAVFGIPPDITEDWTRTQTLLGEFLDTYKATHKHLPQPFYTAVNRHAWMKGIDIHSLNDVEAEAAAQDLIVTKGIVQTLEDLDRDPISLLSEKAAIDETFASLYEPANALKEFWRLAPALEQITTVLRTMPEGSDADVNDALAQLDALWPAYDRLYRSIYTTTPSAFFPIVRDTLQAMLRRQYLVAGNYAQFKRSWLTPRFWTALDGLSRDDPKQSYTRTSVRYHPYLPHRYELPDQTTTRFSREMEHVRATLPREPVEKPPTMLPRDLLWFYDNVNGFVAGLQEKFGDRAVVRVTQEENNRMPYESVDQWWTEAKPFGAWKDSSQVSTPGEPLFWNLCVLITIDDGLDAVNLRAIEEAARNMHGSLSGVEVRLAGRTITIYYRRVSASHLAQEKRYTDALQKVLGEYTPRVRAIRERLEFQAITWADLATEFPAAVEN